MLEAVQKHLDKNPQAMRERRETVEHPFGTENADGGNALLDEAPPKGSHRDGAARPGLQSHPPAAIGRDASIAKTANSSHRHLGYF